MSWSGRPLRRLYPRRKSSERPGVDRATPDRVAVPHHDRIRSYPSTLAGIDQEHGFPSEPTALHCSESKRHRWSECSFLPGSNRDPGPFLIADLACYRLIEKSETPSALPRLYIVESVTFGLSASWRTANSQRSPVASARSSAREPPDR
jgi:hypothetical protein